MNAQPNPQRAVTLIELSSCANCSRIVERVAQNEYGRSTPYEDGGEYEWMHRESRGEECDEGDVARTRRVQDGAETPIRLRVYPPVVVAPPASFVEGLARATGIFGRSTVIDGSAL